MTEDRTQKATPLWIPGLHLRRKSWRSWSTLFVLLCHQLLSLHHQSRPVPWRYRLSMWVIRLAVAAFLQLSLYIEMQPQTFLTERSKVAFLISFHPDQALIWAKAIWNANTAIINSYEAFTIWRPSVAGTSQPCSVPIIRD